MGHCTFSVLIIDRHLLPVIRMSADGLIYGSFLLLQFPETDGPISPVNGMFLTKSTCKATETVEFEGETYPVVKVEISSTSHPFYTGKSKLVDTAGRVDKFMNRYAKVRK